MKIIKGTPQLIRELKTLQANLSALHAFSDKNDIAYEINIIKLDTDALSELGEIESLRLQMAMDRLSKLTETLSNILKKVNDTSSAIIGNLK